MEDVNLSNFSWRKPPKISNVSFVSNETQTNSISQKDAETSVNFQKEQETQTDEVNIGPSDVKNFKISEEVFTLLLDFIQEDSKVNYDRLLEFHKSDKISLENVHSYHIETRNEQIISMISNSSRKTMILFGGSSHETFCSHQARAFFCSSSSTFSLPLPVCALSSVFYLSTQFIIGDMSGNLKMCLKDQILFETNNSENSEGAITCLDKTKHGIISASDNGQLTLWNIQKSSFEKSASVKLKVSDLPRKIRKTSTSTKPLAIVSLQAFDKRDEFCVATETGGLYIFQLPSLNFKSISNSANSIKTILFNPPFIGIAYHSAFSVIITTDSKIVDQIPIISNLAVRCGQYFIFSNHHRLILWSCENQSISIDMPLECQAISSISSDSLNILDNSNNLISYFINDND